MTESRRDALVRIESSLGRHMPVLDGWRGLAILLVIFHNASYVSPRNGSLVSSVYHTGADAGWIGVSVFFVLSGFLITGILLDSLGQPRYFRDFYVRRTLRIFPLYYAVLLVAFLLVPLLPAAAAWGTVVERDQWWFWTYMSNWHLPADYGVQGFGHFWSLAVEEQFYLVWPALVFFAGRRWFPWIAAGAVVAAPLFRWWTMAEGMPLTAGYGFTVARMDDLAIGGLLAWGLRHEAWRARLFAARIPAIAVLSLGLLLVGIASGGLPPRTGLTVVAGQSLVSLLTAGLILATLGTEQFWERTSSTLLAHSWLRGVGKYSYAIYVAHLPIHFLLKGWAGGILAGAPPLWYTPLEVAYAGLVLLLSLGFAVISWNVLERPLLGLKEVWAPRRPRAAAA